jgi:hypothetical protein
MVLDEVWRRLEGVEALSGPHGGPLRRTVKLILDPLVIRPVQYPRCAGPILTAEGAIELTGRVLEAAAVLRATADWFTVLKQLRRTLRITEGNPQDLYFQRCFELATTEGAPDSPGDREIAAAALAELHEGTAGRTTAALREFLSEPGRAAELTALIELAWRRRPDRDSSPTDFTARCTALLDACAAARSAPGRDPGPALLAGLIADHAGTHTGIRLWSDERAPTAAYLGLTDHPAPPRPALGTSASTATMPLPLDRSVFERVFTVLQGGADRTELPTVPELVTAEIARSSAPWALLDESLRVTAAAGSVLALGLRPIGAKVEPESPAQQVINGRWRREAYVLAARRHAVRTDEAATGPLAIVAAELQTPWRPYLRRLWVRLHGRDVREFPVADDELWDLLDGVARSVMLDHRTRVRQALSANVAVAMEDPMESRAS